MADIKKGDWIKVPKGSHLIRDYGKGHYGEGEKPTSRDVTVQVSDVVELDIYYARKHGDPELFKAYDKICYANPYANTYGGDITDEVREQHRANIKAARDAVLASIPGQPKNIICWSNGNKAVLDSVPELVPAPPPKKKAEIKVNKRQMMVPGSRWKVTEDVTIRYQHANPVVIQGEADWEAANPRPWNQPHGTMDQDMAWRDLLFAERKRLRDLHGEHVILDHLVLKAGDIVKVDGKFLSSWNPGTSYFTEYVSNVVPMVREGHGTKQWGVEYKQIEPFIEAEEIPTVKAFVLRYKPTGLFYKANDWDYENRVDKSVKGQQMVDTFMKGKKWDNLGKAKTSILMMTGYYDGLPGADEALPDWSGGGATFDMNDDWELVEFDKLARKEVGVVTEFQDWFKRSWELRALTVKYGSAVRTVYKALEKSGKLDDQKGMVVFTVTDKEALDMVGYWDKKTALTDEDKAEIELATASMKKGSFKKAIDHKSMAVSFTNKSSALMFKLSYAGNLKLTVLDLEEMKEAVDG